MTLNPRRLAPYLLALALTAGACSGPGGRISDPDGQVSAAAASPLSLRDLRQPMAQPAFKGVELYSWPGPDGGWRFSLFQGTNRVKSHRMVTADANAVAGIDEVEKVLNLLAQGESVAWITGAADGPLSGRPRLAYPPEEELTGLIEYARARKVEVFQARR